jgi:hypothetical protein
VLTAALLISSAVSVRALLSDESSEEVAYTDLTRIYYNMTDPSSTISKVVLLLSLTAICFAASKRIEQMSVNFRLAFIERHPELIIAEDHVIIDHKYILAEAFRTYEQQLNAELPATHAIKLPDSLELLPTHTELQIQASRMSAFLRRRHLLESYAMANRI